MTAGEGAARRRRKRSIVTRLRIFWVFIVIVAGAAAYGAYALITLPALRVSAVDVQIAGRVVQKPDVVRAANIDRTRNAWLLDTGAIARRIEAIPYVDRATVRRIPPARVVIAVSEREPVACVRGGSRVVTIDRTQRILQDGCARASALQIVLRDATLGGPGSLASPPALAALLDDGRTLRDAGVQTRSIAVDSYGQLVAVDTRGIQLLLGDDADVAEKAKLVAPVIGAATPGRSIRAVDLRAPTTPTVQFK
ncbi:MAG: FtsQ-type POTRA domain-containing protein [Candidatus Velthaea sp.]